MRQFLTTIALAATCGLAQAGVVAYDNFDYNRGALDGQGQNVNGWAGAWTAPAQTTVTIGGAARFAPQPSIAAAQRSLATAVSAAAVTVEFLFEFSAGSITNNDFLALWFGNSDGPNIGFKANCGDGSCPAGTASGADLFVRTVPGPASDIHAAAYARRIQVNTTYTLFGLLEKTGASPVYDRFSLWVDPSADERSLLTGADAVFNGASTLQSFDKVGFRTANFSDPDRYRVDNLRIATVPEPASLALVGLALAGAGIASRRRKG